MSPAATALSAPDDVVGFDVSVDGVAGRSPEQWARAAFDQAPHLMRGYLVVGWRLGLGLRLGALSSSAYVLGWRVVSSDPDQVVLEVRSRVLTARNVVRVDDARLRLTTSVWYDRAPARLLWSVARPLHRLTVPILLRGAVRRTERAERPGAPSV